MATYFYLFFFFALLNGFKYYYFIQIILLNICFHTVKWSQALLSNTSCSIRKQLNAFKYCYIKVIIHCNFNHLFPHIKMISGIAI